MQLSGGKPSDKFRLSMAKAWSILKAEGSDPVWPRLLWWLDNEWKSLPKTVTGTTGIFAGPPVASAATLGAGIFIEATLKNKGILLGHPDQDAVAGPFWIPHLLEYFVALIPPDEIPKASVDSSEMKLIDLPWLMPFIIRALRDFHDFVGYRPVPVLEITQKVKVRNGERHRPGILWWPRVGVAPIPEAALVKRAIYWLEHAPADILEESGFSLEALTELSLDLREYDHSLPAAQRPNHLFGEWDPERIDNKGRYCRMVVRAMVLRLLWDQVDNPGPGDPSDRNERLEEGAILLAGVILMSAGVLGQGPESVDPTKSLSLIIPRIANYRDAFYGQVLTMLPHSHKTRLDAEARLLKQPLGRVRQALNRSISALRATQLQNRLLARLFGRLGLGELAQERIASIPVPSVRLMVEFESLIQGWEDAPNPPIDHYRWLLRAFRVLKKGVSCGAFADPWNLIGFQGLYPLGPAREDAIPDERLDDLRWMVSSLLSECSRAYATASAQPDKKMRVRFRDLLGRVSEWWSHFPPMGVDDPDHPDAGSEFRSALRVAKALGIWRSKGEATADLPFWKKVLSTLETGEAVAEIFHVLLAHGDLQGALAILIYWIDGFDTHSIAEGRTELTTLVTLWEGAWEEQLPAESSARDRSDHFKLYRRAIDWIDANLADDAAASFITDELVENELDLGDSAEEKEWEENDEEDNDQWDEDGKNGGLDEGVPLLDFPAEGALFDLGYHLGQFDAWVWLLEQALAKPERISLALGSVDAILARASQFRNLMVYLAKIEVPLPGSQVDSVLEFERCRALKFHTLESAGAILFRLEALLCLIGNPRKESGAMELNGAFAPFLALKPVLSKKTPPAPSTGAKKRSPKNLPVETPDPHLEMVKEWTSRLIGRELLHRPIPSGGDWQHWISNRMSLWFVQRTLLTMARVGDFSGIIRFLIKAHQAELTSTLPAPRVSDFHHYFEIAFVESFRAVFRVVSDSSPGKIRSAGLFRGLMRLMERFRTIWLDQGRQTRLSVLDAVDDRLMETLRGFIRHFGRELFPSRLMGYGNIRGTLDQGIEQYLAKLVKDRDPLDRNKLLDELGSSISIEDAAGKLDLILRAVAESYDCFKDYKSTTTVSDYGENLHVLLDFLRVKAAFSREVWNRGPWYLLHREMLEAGLRGTLDDWIGEVMAEFRPIADVYLKKIEELEQRHGIRLLTVRQEIEEGLWMPMENDSLHYHLQDLCEVKEEGDAKAFQVGLDQFRKELAKWVGKPWGVGRDAPDWIRKLDEKSMAEDNPILRFGPLDPQPQETGEDDPMETGGLTLEIIREKLKELETNPEG